jgi:integrase
MACLHRILGFAVENGLLALNVGQKEQRPEIVRGTAPYSGEELKRMREVCTPEELLVFAIFRHTGMRGSDVADLRWGQVHFPDGEIVRHALKNGKLLQIPIHSELMAELRKAYSGQPNGENVITHENKVVDREFLSRFLRLMYCGAKIEGAHNHRFRATFACSALMKGLSVFEVAQLLGDESKTVETHYLRFVPAMRSRVKELMEDDKKGLEAV